MGMDYILEPVIKCVEEHLRADGCEPTLEWGREEPGKPPYMRATAHRYGRWKRLFFFFEDLSVIAIVGQDEHTFILEDPRFDPNKVGEWAVAIRQNTIEDWYDNLPNM